MLIVDLYNYVVHIVLIVIMYCIVYKFRVN